MATGIYLTPAAFEAKITILSFEEGGRRLPPQNFIRWDFGYAEDVLQDGLYMIHPSFLDTDGAPFPKGVLLVGTLWARMHIIRKQSIEYHRGRICVGTKFNCHEGRHVVATGIVTKTSFFDT